MPKKDLKEEPKEKNEQPVPAAEETSSIPCEKEGPIDQAEIFQAQINELNDKYLRLYSEFDNYRKRTIRERIDLAKTASADSIIKLLPVLDDFERAIRAFDSTVSASDALKDGIILIHNKFSTILAQQGLEPIKSIGEMFNTDFHEAVTTIPAPEPEMKGRVIDEIEKGYMLNGRVIRYSKVVVGG